MRQYSCDYGKCLCLNFLSCVKNTLKFIQNKKNDTNDSADCLQDKENDPIKIFEFVTIPSFVAVITCNTAEAIYFVKIVDKNVVKENLRDRFEREIFPRECYLKGFYLQKNRLKNINIKGFLSSTLMRS